MKYRRGNAWTWTIYMIGICFLTLFFIFLAPSYADLISYGRDNLSGRFLLPLEWFNTFAVYFLVFMSIVAAFWAINRSRFDQEFRGQQ